MALNTLSEFAQKCGRPLAHISQDASEKRKKIIRTEAGLVDDKDPVNTAYLAKWSAKNADIISGTGQDIKIITPPTQVRSQKQTTLPDDQVYTDPDTSVPATGMTNDYNKLEILNKQLDAGKKSKEIDILGIKKEKLLGLIVPVFMIRPLLVTQAESQKLAFTDGIEDIITTISATKELTSTEVAMIRKRLLAVVNTAIDRSVDASIKSLDNIISQFSDTRERGERK